MNTSVLEGSGKIRISDHSEQLTYKGICNVVFTSDNFLRFYHSVLHFPESDNGISVIPV